MITLRPLKARIATADHDIVERGSIEIISTQSGPGILIIGRLVNLAIEEGRLVGDIEFTGQYAEASIELYQSNEREPMLTIGRFGCCLTY